MDFIDFFEDSFDVRNLPIDSITGAHLITLQNSKAQDSAFQTIGPKLPEIHHYSHVTGWTQGYEFLIPHLGYLINASSRVRTGVKLTPTAAPAYADYLYNLQNTAQESAALPLGQGPLWNIFGYPGFTMKHPAWKHDAAHSLSLIHI